MLGMDKDKSVVITGKYAEELRDAIRRKYEGDKVNQKEHINDDLEEAADKFARLYDNGTCDGIAQDCFKAGAEWQKEQVIREMIMSDGSYFQRCYELGKKDMKEQMMKEAVEGVVCAGKEGNKWIMTYIGSYESMLKTCKAGDKVKIII